MDTTNVPNTEKMPGEDEKTTPLSKQRLILMLLGIVVCLGIAVASNAYLSSHGAFLHKWVRWHRTTIEADLDTNGSLETLTLGARSLQIRNNNTLIYTTPDEWLVADAAVVDVNSDGCLDVALLVWERLETGEFSQRLMFLCYQNGKLQKVAESVVSAEKIVSLETSGERQLYCVDDQGSKAAINLPL